MMIHDRYHVTDPFCGLVTTESKKERAEVAAVIHAERCEGIVTVYDAMAHRGRPEEWLPYGFILRYRD